ncbi:MAG: hypothetical protein KC464_02800, partial [Myxococcales bacterium]|nr:hypothetical protein [Myxococcales bacterium]
MRVVLLTFAAALVAGVAGCPRPPQPAHVDPSQVTQLEIHAAGGATRYCPQGDALQLGGTVTTSDGKVIESWAPGASIEGRLPMTSFEWTTSWGSVDGDGRLRLPRDPIAALDRDVTIQARLVDRPDLVAELTVAPSYACGGTVGDSGVSGDSGWYGQDGARGQDGQSGTDDRAPTDGQDGGDGGGGGDAGDGGPGPSIDVALTRIETPRHGTLVAVRVVTASGDGFYL